jgi:hypothetical protein
VFARPFQVHEEPGDLTGRLVGPVVADSVNGDHGDPGAFRLCRGWHGFSLPRRNGPNGITVPLEDCRETENRWNVKYITGAM